jgi:aminoglycoside 3-N-acetyltransferase
LDVINHLPIKKNEINFIASDLRRLAIKAYKNKDKFDVNKIIDLILDKIGSRGTLMLPTYNWDFCNKKIFDMTNTKSQTGMLSQKALDREEFIRTKHPIYSFAVCGKEKDTLSKFENTHSFGVNTPFDYLHKSNVKTILLDVSYQRSFTFVHHVEKIEAVSYRFLKSFTGKYVDEDNITSMRTYYMYVRNLDMGVISQISPMGSILEVEGASNLFFVGDISIKEIDLIKAYDLIQKDIRENSSKNLYLVSK